jgi:CubicO group peptidase (beta-lactamase class C family)
MIDDSIDSLLREHRIVGLSLAIIRDGEIVEARGFGLADRDTSVPVAPETLFQAGSISKCFAAVAALSLVERGKLSLDAPVNESLTTWKVPESEFTTTRKVLLRDILCHSSGLRVHGYFGYPVGSAVPTIVEVLNGVEGANCSAEQVNFVPGSRVRYSGGGYSVLQQLICDVTGEKFEEFMRQRILEPLNLKQSTFAQPLPSHLAASAATGHEQNGNAVVGRWHVYPQMAAAGLWTTAADVARFVIAIQEGFANISQPIISAALVREMLTRQKENMGLGVFLAGEGEKLQFYHSGRNRGFDSLMLAAAKRRNGVVILSNSNTDPQVFRQIVRVVGQQYRW